MPTNPASPDELRRQRAQLDALVATGVLEGKAAAEARSRLDARLRAAEGGAPPDAAAAPDEAPARPSRGLSAAVVLFVLVFGLAGYAGLASHAGWNVGPGDSGDVAGAAGAHGPDPAQIEAMVKQLAQRLKDHPEDAEGWAMLGRSYSAQGRASDAVTAYRRVVALRPGSAQALADLADGLATAHNKSLDGEPEQLIARAVALDPKNLKALALAGTVAFNHSDYAKAVDYWQRAVAESDPASDFTQALRAALNEARQRAGMPALAAAEAASEPEAGGGGAAAAPVSGAAVSGRVTLKPGLAAQLPPDTTVYIFARAPSGPPMPLAVLKRKLSDLPLDFRLDDSLAMSPAARLSSAPEVIVSARASRSGSPIAAAGDFQAVSKPVKLGTEGLQLEIGDPVN
ncbi:MAG: tetratricopeptide repeat protein [Burkholderiales bacterium]|nr:tetratricopeptide repeat protein [Burkholderiales bacterium]